MAKFIEISGYSVNKRLVNIDHISDIGDNRVYLDSSTYCESYYIDCTESYEELKEKLIKSGAEIY